MGLPGLTCVAGASACERHGKLLTRGTGQRVGFAERQMSFVPPRGQPGWSGGLMIKARDACAFQIWVHSSVLRSRCSSFFSLPTYLCGINLRVSNDTCCARTPLPPYVHRNKKKRKISDARATRVSPSAPLAQQQQQASSTPLSTNLWRIASTHCQLFFSRLVSDRQTRIRELFRSVAFSWRATSHNKDSCERPLLHQT